MKKLLIINASPRSERSHSRQLTNVFLREWEQKFPESQITLRDLGKSNIPHVTEEWIAGAFKLASLRSREEEEALRISSELIAELKEADVIVLGSPMYNWSVPSSLKAYIDQVLRVNETWKTNTEDLRNPYIGQLEGKTVVLLFARGAEGYEVGGYNERINYQSEYLKFVFSIMGITDVTEYSVNGEAFGPEVFERSKQIGNEQIRKFVANVVN